jgi:SAM-dependent methyltransferase
MIPQNTPYLRRQVEKLLAFAKIQPSDRVLEIGCGMGRYTLILAELGVNIEGLDLSPVLLEKLKGYAGDRFHIPLHSADIASMPPALKERYDAVIGFFTLHHIHDLSLCFRSAAAALKKGGSVYFIEPNPWNVLYYIQILITPHQTWQGERGMLRMRGPVMSRVMQDAGLVNFRMLRFGFFPPFVTNTAPGYSLEGVMEKVPLWRPLLPFHLFAATKPN